MLLSYCRLYGKAGSVDLDAIELIKIPPAFVLSSTTLDSIFNCTEILKELDTIFFFITPLSTSGPNAFRECSVFFLFCINASGTSLTMAKTMRSFVRGSVLFS